jgi:hypothetical protein
MLAWVGSVGVRPMQGSGLFVLAMLFVVLAFGMAIPNILGLALANYGDRLGTADALFGLLYYLLIGFGLQLAAWGLGFIPLDFHLFRDSFMRKCSKELSFVTVLAMGGLVLH